LRVAGMVTHASPKIPKNSGTETTVGYLDVTCIR
jgi:hypothetical protein